MKQVKKKYARYKRYKRYKQSGVYESYVRTGVNSFCPTLTFKYQNIFDTGSSS